MSMEKLIGKQVKIVHQDGNEIRAVKGILIDKDENYFYIGYNSKDISMAIGAATVKSIKILVGDK